MQPAYMPESQIISFKATCIELNKMSGSFNATGFRLNETVIAFNANGF